MALVKQKEQVEKLELCSGGTAGDAAMGTAVGPNSETVPATGPHNPSPQCVPVTEIH